jgi:hypothetical protein
LPLDVLLRRRTLGADGRFSVSSNRVTVWGAKRSASESLFVTIATIAGLSD